MTYLVINMTKVQVMRTNISSTSTKLIMVRSNLAVVAHNWSDYEERTTKYDIELELTQ